MYASWCDYNVCNGNAIGKPTPTPLPKGGGLPDALFSLVSKLQLGNALIPEAPASFCFWEQNNGKFQERYVFQPS